MFHRVLDLYAGHGVGVALQRLGATDLAVENNKDVIATRRLNGMDIAYEDVWDIDKAEGLEFDTLHASPPCQSYSMAGKGRGRKQLDLVYGAMDQGLYCDMGALREWSDSLDDPRSGHVLVPLAYIHRFGPTFVSLEQVTPVRHVWDRYVDILEALGYSAKAEILHAEQYGVPQTRKRAILVARNDGHEVHMPKPTHSRYYSHTPDRLDPGVKKWVSMHDALGRLTTVRPAPTVTGGGTATGGWEPFGNGGRKSAQMGMLLQDHGNAMGDVRITTAEAAALQTYPEDFTFCGTKGAVGQQIGNAVPPLLAERIFRALWAKP